MKTSSFAACLLAVLCVVTGAAFARPEDVPKIPSLAWIDRPWEYRYLLFVEPNERFLDDRKEQGFRMGNSKGDGPRVASMPGPFAASWLVQRGLDYKGNPDQLAVVRLNIKQDRTITTPNDWGVELKARLNWYEEIVLAPTQPNPDKIIEFGEFFMGSFAASDTAYSPSICSRSFGDNVLPAPLEKSGRYVEKNYDPITDGYFGCREWTAQLYDSQRPYIDVTSYEYALDYEKPKLTSGPRKDMRQFLKPLTWAPKIKPFIGFSRFEDVPKPVIGNHLGQWVCLNDCPKGEAPGQIADIKQWATKQGWPVPMPPKDVRAFKDQKVKPGDFVD